MKSTPIAAIFALIGISLCATTASLARETVITEAPAQGTVMLGTYIPMQDAAPTPAYADTQKAQLYAGKMIKQQIFCNFAKFLSLRGFGVVDKLLVLG